MATTAIAVLHILQAKTVMSVNLAILGKTVPPVLAAAFSAMMGDKVMALVTLAQRALPALSVISACLGALVKTALALALAPMIPVKTA